jgi:lysophospholipid acyltransferase (LPLAT)-like uncharacterized protein
VANLIRLFKKRSQPIICFAWHANELMAMCSFRGFPRDIVPVAIGHDGPRSRALQHAGAWYGLPSWIYRRHSAIQPKVQLINFLKAERPVIGLFPDSGGPDGQVRLGFVEVAQAAEARLVPMTWHVQPVVVVGSSRRFCFPVPFSRIRAHYGQPIEEVRTTRDECREALDDLERRISAGSSAFDGEQPRSPS